METKTTTFDVDAMANAIAQAIGASLAPLFAQTPTVAKDDKPALVDQIEAIKTRHANELEAIKTRHANEDAIAKNDNPTIAEQVAVIAPSVDVDKPIKLSATHVGNMSIGFIGSAINPTLSIHIPVGANVLANPAIAKHVVNDRITKLPRIQEAILAATTSPAGRSIGGQADLGPTSDGGRLILVVKVMVQYPLE